MKKILISSIMAMLPFLAGAQEAMPFLSIPHGNSSISMARTVTAATSMLEFHGVSLDAGYLSWMPGSVMPSTDCAAMLGWSNGKYAIGLDFILDSSDEMTVTGADGFELDSYKPSNMDAGLSLAYGFASGFGIGADIHYVIDKSSPYYSISALYADVSASYRITDGFTICAGAMHVGQRVSDEAGHEFNIPASAFIDAEYRMDIMKYMTIRAQAEARYYLAGGFSAGAGAELQLVRLLLIRAGYHYAGEECPLPSYCSIGCGLRLGGVTVDACYVPETPVIGGTYGIGVNLNF